MEPIRENAWIEALVERMPRSDSQIGGLQESDAELVRLPGTNTVLAVTTDAIVEEIELGLYDDPYLVGWMAVIVNASDLAAVGAEPLGILLNETLLESLSREDVSGIQEGIRRACIATGLGVLGGDTNSGSRLQIGATALGVVPDGQPVTRLGCRPGDALFATGPLGLGNSFALTKLAPGAMSPIEIHYEPQPKLAEGRIIRRYASACMDTSDGALATLDQLMRLNDVGFEVAEEGILHSTARQLADWLDLPAWIMLAGLHGEFELIFTVPPERIDALFEAGAEIDWTPMRIGTVVPEVGVWLKKTFGRSALPTGRIRNLFARPPDDIRECIDQILRMEEPCTQ